MTTAATIASANVIGRRRAATVHRIGNFTRKHGQSGTARMETFSDGVFAIAATLLVLEFGVESGPGHNLGSRATPPLAVLSRLRDELRHDRDHLDEPSHTGRDDRRASTGTMLFLNMLLLMTVAFLPFPTKLVARLSAASGEQSGRLAYAATFVVMAVHLQAVVAVRVPATGA